MTDHELCVVGPARSPHCLVLAHGAGAPMDSEFMTGMAEGLAAEKIRVVRFEFPYMAQRRQTGGKRPPNGATILLESYREVLAQVGRPERLVIGGKSMGGRIASMVADEMGVRGLVCLGYPFHPPGRPEKLRTEHLEALATPTLIVQGERDPFGTPVEVPGWNLSSQIRFVWMPDGDHSFKPRVRSGRTGDQNLAEAVAAVAAFITEL